MQLDEQTPFASLAAMLAETFADDPFYRWYFADGADPVAYFADKLRAAADRGELIAAADGAAVLLFETHPARPVESAPGTLPEAGGSDPGYQTGRFFERIAASHPTPAHVYLDIIGVGAAARGSGIGGRLMTEWLAALDAAGGSLVFLHASTPRSRAFYERFGFAAGATLPLPDGSGAVVSMTRKG